MIQTMKPIKCSLLGLCIVFAFSSVGFAIDPSAFLEVLGVEINGNTHSLRDFRAVKQILGDAKQIDKGDAGEYEGRVEYVLFDRSQSIVFKIGECHEGYTIERISEHTTRVDPTVLKSSIKAISAVGLELGMKRSDAERLFTGSILGGWKLEAEKKGPDTQRISYQKTVESENGREFCDHIWITLKFDAYSKLSGLDVLSGGCHDSSCEE